MDRFDVRHVRNAPHGEAKTKDWLARDAFAEVNWPSWQEIFHERIRFVAPILGYLEPWGAAIDGWVKGPHLNYLDILVNNR